VEERCEALVAQQLLYPLGATTWPDGTVATRYAFVHALYQQVVYERLGAGRRVRLHQWLGECLEAAYGAQAGEIAAELAEHLFTLAQRQADPAFLLSAHATLGMTLFIRGEVAVAHGHLARGSALYVPAYHRTLVARYGLDLGVVARCFMALSLWPLGAPEQALAQMDEARTLAQDLSHPYRPTVCPFLV
jgi:hypothetical protein